MGMELIDLLLLCGPGMMLVTDTVQRAWQEWMGCDFEKRAWRINRGHETISSNWKKNWVCAVHSDSEAYGRNVADLIHLYSNREY